MACIITACIVMAHAAMAHAVMARVVYGPSSQCLSAGFDIASVSAGDCSKDRAEVRARTCFFLNISEHADGEPTTTRADLQAPSAVRRRPAPKLLLKIEGSRRDQSLAVGDGRDAWG